MPLIAVLGAAGGVGTSLVACNLALAIVSKSKAPTLLMDLDINAAPLASFLDLAPELGLLAALAEVESLDEHALPGYVDKHRSGLRVMGAPANRCVRRGTRPRRFATLMGLLSAHFRYIIADASHALDDLASR